MKKRTAFFWILMVCAAVLMLEAGTRIASAAITGKISGVITDEATSAPLANVSVTLVGTSSTATTNDDGYYVMTNIPPGGYDVRVELAGYRSKTVMGAKVFAGLTTTLNFALDTGEVITLDEIEVTAAKPLIKRDATQSSRIIEAEEIAAMPRDTVNGILETQAGVAVDNATGTLHIRGGRAMEIKYLIDGIPINDPILSGLGVQVGANSIEQMEVITGGFNAETRRCAIRGD